MEHLDVGPDKGLSKMNKNVSASKLKGGLSK